MSEEQNVSLQSLLIPSKTVSLDFPGLPDFKVDITHLAREELIRLTKKCTTTVFKKHQPVEEFDSELFGKMFTKEVVKGWKGLKFKYLEKLVLADISGFDPDAELPFTEENAIMLVTNSTSFENWVTTSSQELENFTNSK